MEKRFKGIDPANPRTVRRVPSMLREFNGHLAGIAERALVCHDHPIELCAPYVARVGSKPKKAAKIGQQVVWSWATALA